MASESNLGRSTNTLAGVQDAIHPRPEPQGRVLVIADDLAIRDVLAILVGIEGCDVKVTTEEAAVKELVQTWQPDMILFDLSDPESEASTLIHRYRALTGSDIPVVVLADEPIAEDQVVEIGAAAALPKPFSVEELLDLLARFGHCADDQ